MSAVESYFFAGGGTGGHLTPGLAVAERLRTQLGPACRAVFIGSGRPIERGLVEAAGHPHVALPVQSTQSFRRRPLTFLCCNWRAYRQAYDLLARDPPRAVIGLGGFASLPLVWAAARRRIPTLLLEQNVIPGRANRFLGRRVDAVCVAFPETQAWFRRTPQVAVTGNPVRAPIAELTTAARSPASDAPPTILVLGGSQGAAGVNDALMHMVAEAPGRWQGATFVHQTGPQQVEAVRTAYARAGLKSVVEPFIHDLAPWYQQASLAVSRAGATTLAELACAGCPAVLVPYPHAADDHQTRNAESYARQGAAQIVRQASHPADTAANLGQTIADLLADRAILGSLRQGMRGLARPEAAGRVAEVLQSLTARAMT